MCQPASQFGVFVHSSSSSSFVLLLLPSLFYLYFIHSFFLFHLITVINTNKKIWSSPHWIYHRHCKPRKSCERFEINRINAEKYTHTHTNTLHYTRYSHNNRWRSSRERERGRSFSSSFGLLLPNMRFWYVCVCVERGYRTYIISCERISFSQS